MLDFCPVEVSNFKFIGGMDEVGRGSFAGPVVSALVVLPHDFHSELLNDSKKLTDLRRRKVYKEIMDNHIALSVQAVSVKTINKIGIDKATFLSMQKCIDDLLHQGQEIDHLLIDGDRWETYEGITSHTIPQGDGKFMPIAAASIVAKVRRDDYMIKLHEQYPHYNWVGNKGYYCKKHKAGLLEHGGCDYHRTQFIRNHLSE
jgi:ribonuclease HII